MSNQYTDKGGDFYAGRGYNEMELGRPNLHYQYQPTLESLKDHPRYQSLLKKTTKKKDKPPFTPKPISL